MKYTACVMGRPNTAKDFWKRVDKAGPKSVVGTRCWLWTGGTTTGGYGVFAYKGMVLRAHRFAYESVKGEVLGDQDLHHLCLRPPCVRPGHLKPMTSVDHMLLHGGHAGPRVTHCKHGHAYEEGNLIHRSDGRRDCLACARTRQTRLMREGLLRDTPAIEICKRGHNLQDPKIIGNPPSGGWYCKPCRKIQQQERRARQKVRIR